MLMQIFSTLIECYLSPIRINHINFLTLYDVSVTAIYTQYESWMEQNRKNHAIIKRERVDERVDGWAGGVLVGWVAEGMRQRIFHMECTIIVPIQTILLVYSYIAIKKRVILCFYKDLQMVCWLHCVAQRKYHPHI